MLICGLDSKCASDIEMAPAFKKYSVDPPVDVSAMLLTNLTLPEIFSSLCPMTYATAYFWPRRFRTTVLPVIWADDVR